MISEFTVSASAHFDRLAKRLAKQHPEFPAQLETVLAILKTDPYNHSGKHPIRKLSGKQADPGRWRLRIGRFRFRYDIVAQTVELEYCGLRREDSY